MIKIKVRAAAPFSLAIGHFGKQSQMYGNAAILAAFLLIYSGVAGRVERSRRSPHRSYQFSLSFRFGTPEVGGEGRGEVSDSRALAEVPLTHAGG
jgi:hypothetical protein